MHKQQVIIYPEYSADGLGSAWAAWEFFSMEPITYLIATTILCLRLRKVPKFLSWAVVFL